MSKLLGLLDVLESKILEGKKVPLTEKVMVDEDEVMSIIDKIRSVLQSDDVIQNNIQIKPVNEFSSADNQASLDAEKNSEIEKAKKIKEGAQEYAQYILSNLQLIVTKMQNNLVKLEKNIEGGRKVIEERNSIEEDLKQEVLEKEILNDPI
ncbi:MAG: hypothetical protein CMP21_07480 [Rickettsiales bacterium]|nr:hypothetical protein [Actinomycetota bacterium]MBA95547.1 hypothetical protein [Rickettsiales bacterium]MBE32927.1 hypothetical protein [bacterium]|tara:strand:- start:1563 stop:2015 length:453 start_codon:yes stop_codon:yes gene_type:complete